MKYAEVKQLFNHGIIEGFNALRANEKSGWKLEILLENPNTGENVTCYLESQRKGVRVFKTFDALLSEVERIKGHKPVRLALEDIVHESQYGLNYDA